MKSKLLDTNALLRFLLKDIPSQTIEVRKLIQKAEDGSMKLIIPEIVIFEIVFTLTRVYKYPKDQVIEGVDLIVKAKSLSVESRQIFIQALKFYKEQSLSFVDCFLLVKSNQLQVELFTFDKKLKNLSK